MKKSYEFDVDPPLTDDERGVLWAVMMDTIEVTVNSAGGVRDFLGTRDVTDTTIMLRRHSLITWYRNKDRITPKGREYL